MTDKHLVYDSNHRKSMIICPKTWTTVSVKEYRNIIVDISLILVGRALLGEIRVLQVLLASFPPASLIYLRPLRLGEP